MGKIVGRLAHYRTGAGKAFERRLARRAAARGAGVVLLYHRVAETAENPWGDVVSPARFEEQIAALSAEMRLMPLAELIAAADRGSIPDRAVAISFDDGYADNLSNALPILRRHQAPATFFIATGWRDPSLPYWWDELSDLVLGPGKRPPRIDVTIGSRPVVAATADREERLRALHGAIHPALSGLPPAAVDSGLEVVRGWARRAAEEPSVNGVDADAARPLSTAELERLAADPLVELGAHTAFHPRMPTLSADARRVEAERSRDAVAEVVGERPRFFAYPFGAVDRGSEASVREAGFERGFGTQGYVPVTTAARPFRVPRMPLAGDRPPVLLDRLRGLQGAGRAAA
jgi:peptidoglycan/xylan/chitin deacetylase (PgdA/CDA1 family)